MLLKETALVRLVGLRIPMLLFIGPRVVQLDEEGCAILIPLTWRTKNRLIGAMYFGALCAGADLAGGLPAAKLIMSAHRDLRLVFGELRAEFLKRADGDVLFRSRNGRAVTDAVRRAVATHERVTIPVEVVAAVPAKYGDEPVARFSMSLSLKVKDASSPARADPGGNGRSSAAVH